MSWASLPPELDSRPFLLSSRPDKRVVSIFSDVEAQCHCGTLTRHGRTRGTPPPPPAAKSRLSKSSSTTLPGTGWDTGLPRVATRRRDGAESALPLLARSHPLDEVEHDYSLPSLLMIFFVRYIPPFFCYFFLILDAWAEGLRVAFRN